MRFSSKRGRPVINRGTTDFGTKELQNKRSQGLTAEPIDLCLNKGIISDSQYKAALHLRWLYTIRFGVPTPQAYDHSYIPGVIHINDNRLEWVIQRNKEYGDSIKLLKSIKACRIVINTAIFNHYPEFLYIKSRKFDNYKKFLEGLDILVKYY